MDYFLFNVIHDFANRWFLLDWLIIFFAEYVQYFLAALVVGFLFFGKGEDAKKNRRMVVLAFASVAFSRLIVVPLIQFFYFRPRPFVMLDFEPLFNHASVSSFPSGHAIIFFTLATAVYFYNKKLGLFLFVAAVLIGLARILGGVHWPSDIIAGALVGILSAYFIRYVIARFFGEKTKPVV